MEDLKLWAKTFLVAYKKLPEFVSALDKCVENCCKGSFYGTCVSKSGSTLEQFEQIINYTYRKRGLILIRQIVGEVFERLSEEDVFILKAVYMQKMTLAEIGVQLNIPRSTCYRHIAKAVENMADTLSEMGYGLNWCRENFKNEQIILRFKEKLRDRNKSTECVCSKTASKEKTCKCEGGRQNDENYLAE